MLAKEGFAPKLGWDTRRSPDPAPRQLAFQICGHRRAGIVCPGCRGGMEHAGLLQGQNAGRQKVSACRKLYERSLCPSLAAARDGEAKMS